MRSILKITLILFFFNSYGQENIKINQYLNGVWKMECCSSFYEIYYDNVIYKVNEKTKGVEYNTSAPKNFYCFPK